MESEISTNELFHFTSFKNLCGIIENGFFPRFNLEHTFLSNLFDRPASFYPIPMVCFCDIPLKLVKMHSEKFGKTAIGLTKAWGYKKGLNPVIYISRNSKLGDILGLLANGICHLNLDQISEDDPGLFLQIDYIIRATYFLSGFFKQYEVLNDYKVITGNKSVILKKGRYYDEREWRYVPIPDPTKERLFFPTVNFIDEDKLESANDNLKKYKLTFDVNDIKYIIVETKKQENSIITIIHDVYNVDEKKIKELIIYKCISKKK